MKRESSTVHGGVGSITTAQNCRPERDIGCGRNSSFFAFSIWYDAALHLALSISPGFSLSLSAGFSINYDNNISTQHPASNKPFETNHRDFFDTVVFCVSVSMLAMSCSLFVRCSSCTGNSKQTAEIVLIPSAKKNNSLLHSDFPTLPGSPRSSFMSGMHHQREAMHGKIKAVENHKSHSLCNNWWMRRDWLAGGRVART